MRVCGPRSDVAQKRLENSMSLLTMRRSAPACSATSANALLTSLVASKMSAGTPFLKIPAFSFAMAGRVFPSSLVWSKSIVVTTDTSGVITFVLSSRPPRPTSITATSTACSAKCLKASAVIASKNVGSTLAFVAAACTARSPSVTSCLEMSAPLMVMRSRRSTRCGLV